MTALEDRVANGIRWLTEHDPTGAFHLWFESGILPQDGKPAQSDERKEAYREYWKARQTWEKLFKALQAEESRAHKKEVTTNG